MSNSLAIATVTEAFRQQIQKALTDSESETGIPGAELNLREHSNGLIQSIALLKS